MNFIVNGASGWLGQSTGHVLKRAGLVTNSSELKLFGSKSRIGNFGPWGKQPINKLDDSGDETIQANYECDMFIQLAFKTKDYVATLGEKQYVESNRRIINASIDLLKRSRAKRVVLVSSGIVSRFLELNMDIDKNPYTLMKIEEEIAFSEFCKSHEAQLLVLRLWGATGADMTEPLKYAIGDLINQAIFMPELNIKSNRPVYRRYLDSRDQMEIAIRSCIKYGSMTLESGGDVVEMANLASLIRDCYSPGKRIFRTTLKSLQPDFYFSTSTKSEFLAEEMGISILSISDQIRETGKAVMGALPR